jgi:hypothetical protein
MFGPKIQFKYLIDPFCIFTKHIKMYWLKIPLIKRFNPNIKYILFRYIKL